MKNKKTKLITYKLPYTPFLFPISSSRPIPAQEWDELTCCHILLSYFRFLPLLIPDLINCIDKQVAIYSFPISDFFNWFYFQNVTNFFQFSCHILLSYFRFLLYLDRIEKLLRNPLLPYTPFLFPISSVLNDAKRIAYDVMLPYTPFLFPISS